MPTFVNGENIPIYPPNANIVHIGSHPHDPNFQKLANPKDTLLLTPSSTAIDTNESFDDNLSSRSSNSSDPSVGMNADEPYQMTSLPNGTSSRDSNNTATTGLDQKYSSNMKGPLSGRTSTDRQATVNVESQRKSISESLIKRSSVDSSSRNPAPQHPIEPSRMSWNNSDSPNIDGLNGNHVAPVSDSSAANFPSEPFLSSSYPNSDPAQRKSPSPQNFSSSHYPSTSANASASTSALQPPTPGLKHRHTLEVPKVQPSRGSRDSTDTAYTSGRFSPTGGAGPSQRRGSLNLGRKNTRSLHSDLPREEIAPDDDALRWAEAYRQKRAKKKKREDDDDDRVLVGTKVDENHANWTTAYNMLTGIRVSVSRTNAKLDRPLTDADFETKQKSTFDMYVSPTNLLSAIY